MDRKKFFKDKIKEIQSTTGRGSCRRLLSFQDEVLNEISLSDQEQGCIDLTPIINSSSTSTTNQLLINIKINMDDSLPYPSITINPPITGMPEETVVASSEDKRASNTNDSHAETFNFLGTGMLEETVVASSEDKLASNTNDSHAETSNFLGTVDTAEEHVLRNDENNILNLPMTEKNTTRSKRKKLFKQTYCEFVASDNEDPFLTDGSSSWIETGDSDTSFDTTTNNKMAKKKRKQINTTELTGNSDNTVGEKGIRKKRISKKKQKKELKTKGQEYTKSNGTTRNKREIKPNPCIGKKCGNNCQNISEERRLSVFNHFWRLPSERQRDWIVNMSKRVPIKRKRSKDSGKRTYTFEYYINDNEDRRKICQQFLLNTLDVSQTYVYYTLSNSIEGSSKDDLRGKIIPANKTKEATKQSVINYIKKLPALPSHYCQKDTSKLYLPVEFKNQKNIYRIYKEEKLSGGIDYVSEKVFLQIFKTEFNIGFHVPKKDKCLTCRGIKLDAANTEESKAEKEKHLEEKKESKDRYIYHRELCEKRKDIICTSFDLQKVLNTPYGESMLLYYSRKYVVYNLCFYENGSREGYCFIWGESEGKRGDNEIASIILKYINIVDSRGTVKHLLLYSDSCPGQNKNRTVLAALHYALKNCKNILSIQINYLLPGHTEMSVNSMHSVIEGSVKNVIVQAPSQWATICQLARKDPKPYNVSYLNHTDFQDYENFADKYFRGNLTGKISKIRVATIRKSSINQMSVKYSMKKDSEEEIISVTGISNAKINDQLYKNALPITKTKYNDLKKLCDNNVIDKMFQKEYLTLSTVAGIDTLVETDIEDDTV